MMLIDIWEEVRRNCMILIMFWNGFRVCFGYVIFLKVCVGIMKRMEIINLV